MFGSSISDTVFFLSCLLGLVQFPVGIASLLYSLGKRSKRWFIVGIALSIFGGPIHVILTPFYRGALFDVRASVEVPGYRVEYTQQRGILDSEEYFLITRALDGKNSKVWVDGDGSQCWGLKNEQVGPKVYFVCPDEVINENTPYVDIEKLSVYPDEYHFDAEAVIVEQQFYDP